MPISFDTLRIGKRYYLRNFGEESRFEVVEITDQDIRVKDLFTLESFPISDLVKYGTGNDYEFQEIE